MDIIGPFAPRKGQEKFLLIRVNYITKWIEAEPLAFISAKNIQNFVWRSIVYWCGVSHTTIIDNDRQFIDRGLQSFYEDLGINSITSSVEHPHPNRQVEATNKVILNELKKRLSKAKGRWTEELMEVLWVYRCNPNIYTGNPLQPCVRDRSYDPSRGRRAYHLKATIRSDSKSGEFLGWPRSSK